MRSIARDYAVLGDKLWERFKEKSKSEQGWYYESLAESLVGLENIREHQEFKRLIKEVFGE